MKSIRLDLDEKIYEQLRELAVKSPERFLKPFVQRIALTALTNELLTLQKKSK